MYLFIILGVIAFLTFVIGWWATDDGFEGFAMAFMVIIFGGAITAILAMIIGAIVDPYTNHRDVTYLQNIQDNTDTQGQFFLGTGNIEGVPMYSYYERTDDNSYERRDVEASEATIHYTDRVPRLVYTYGKHDQGAWQDWYIDPAEHQRIHEHYDFYIPHGSITNEYRLDAK